MRWNKTKQNKKTLAIKNNILKRITYTRKSKEEEEATRRRDSMNVRCARRIGNIIKVLHVGVDL